MIGSISRPVEFRQHFERAMYDVRREFGTKNKYGNFTGYVENITRRSARNIARVWARDNMRTMRSVPVEGLVKLA